MGQLHQIIYSRMHVALQIHQIRNKEPILYFLQSYNYHTNRQHRRNKTGTAFAMRIIGVHLAAYRKNIN